MHPTWKLRLSAAERKTGSKKMSVSRSILDNSIWVRPSLKIFTYSKSPFQEQHFGIFFCPLILREKNFMGVFWRQFKTKTGEKHRKRREISSSLALNFSTKLRLPKKQIQFLCSPGTPVSIDIIFMASNEAGKKVHPPKRFALKIGVHFLTSF